MPDFSSICIRLRTLFYKRKYKVKIGKNTWFQGKVELSNDGNISFGNNCVICRWSCFRTYKGFINIGNNCSINSFCHISGNGGVTIGNNVRIATQCVIVSANHNFESMDIPIYLQGETRKEIIIGDDCWLGAGVKVLSGVTIGKGSIIGAGSVVNKDIPEYSIVVGVPGKVIKKRNG